MVDAAVVGLVDAAVVGLVDAAVVGEIYFWKKYNYFFGKRDTS
jgi:hypothetical protein